MAVSHPIPTNSPPSSLTRWTADVERELRRHALGGDSPLALMTTYHMGWVDADGAPAEAGGKHVRSNLCCWAAEACGGDAAAALPAACALELVHNFTLVHDDVQDRDELRRGRPAVWKLWGTEQAINAGDGIFALAIRPLLDAPLDADRRLDAIRVLIDATLEVIDGQCLDLQHECAPDTPAETYMRIIEGKTAALLGAALELGALCAGAPAEVRERMRRAGRLLGTAFQLRDDWLGVWGATARTGKDGRGDLVRRKLTYPVAATYGALADEQRAELRRLYADRGPEAAPRIERLMEYAHADHLTANATSATVAAALNEVSGCKLDPAREREFAGVARYVADRDH